MIFRKRLRLLPRRQRIGVLLATALACIGIAVVGTDKLTAMWIEDRTASAFQAATGTAAAPSVQVSGFPVLYQVTSGKLNHVTVDAKEIPAAQSHPVPITRLDLTLEGVRAYDRARTAQADNAHGSAFLSYSDLSNALGLTISEDSQPGRVDATATAPLIGDVTVSAKIASDGAQTISFQDPQVKGNLPADADAAITHVLEEPITLQSLPHGLSLIGVTTDGSGVHAQLAGKNVTFRTYADTNG